MQTPDPSSLVSGSDLPDLRSRSLEEVEALVTQLGERRFRAAQLFRWLHQKAASHFEEMTDLPLAFRQKLAAAAKLDTLRCAQVQTARDQTAKYRFQTVDGHFVESVYIPDQQRHTLCVSTQVGCAMGCAFCRTATMGLIRHLHAGEIVDQVYRVSKSLGDSRPRPLTNLVFMGMGEPLHNYDQLQRALHILQHPQGSLFSHRHLTVSTSGLVPMIARLGAETNVKLAISLNATTDEQRSRLMPINKKWGIAQLMQACREFPSRQGRRVTLEYVMLRGINDSLDDARRLAQLVDRLPIKINLIAYNASPGLDFAPSTPEQISKFHQFLLSRELTAITRQSRGSDIAAACGQLSGSVHDKAHF